MFRAARLIGIATALSVCFSANSPPAAAQSLNTAQHVHGGRYLGLKIVEVDVEKPKQLDALLEGGMEVLDCVPHLGTLRVVADAQQISEMQEMGLAPHVLFDDFQALVDAERRPVERGDPFNNFFLDSS